MDYLPFREVIARAAPPFFFFYVRSPPARQFPPLLSAMSSRCFSSLPERSEGRLFPPGSLLAGDKRKSSLTWSRRLTRSVFLPIFVSPRTMRAATGSRLPEREERVPLYPLRKNVFPFLFQACAIDKTLRRAEAAYRAGDPSAHSTGRCSFRTRSRFFHLIRRPRERDLPVIGGALSPFRPFPAPRKPLPRDQRFFVRRRAALPFSLSPGTDLTRNLKRLLSCWSVLMLRAASDAPRSFPASSFPSVLRWPPSPRRPSPPGISIELPLFASPARPFFVGLFLGGAPPHPSFFGSWFFFFFFFFLCAPDKKWMTISSLARIGVPFLLSLDFACRPSAAGGLAAIALPSCIDEPGRRSQV